MSEDKIEFQCWEVIGTEVVLDPTKREPLKEREAIKVGDTVYVAGLFEEYVKLTVAQSEDGGLYGLGEVTVVPFEFAADGRKCWVGTGFVNRRAMKLMMERDGDGL